MCVRSYTGAGSAYDPSVLAELRLRGSSRGGSWESRVAVAAIWRVMTLVVIRPGCWPCPSVMGRVTIVISLRSYLPPHTGWVITSLESVLCRVCNTLCNCNFVSPQLIAFNGNRMWLPLRKQGRQDRGTALLHTWRQEQARTPRSKFVCCHGRLCSSHRTYWAAKGYGGQAAPDLPGTPWRDRCG